MNKYFLYILYSSSIDQYYIGISHNPEKRLTYHNSAPKGWTRRGRPWELVFRKQFPNQNEARKWEKKIKDQTRRDIIELITQNKFHWED
jgi:putative endonuclease